MTGPTWTAAPNDAWVALALVEGLSARKSLDLAAHFGSAEGALTASRAALRAAGLDDTIIGSMAHAWERAAREQRVLAQAGATVLSWASDAYPASLRTIAEPPLALFVRGTLDRADVAVSIVGSRRAGEYGRRVAEELARGLALVGITVVSGLAAGIDSAAHRGALAAGGRTVAVMATGIDRVYPAWNRGLAHEIAAHGALVTEFPCGTPPLQFHFPRRNRIISGLAVGTVVVEAAERSGSLITAEYAVDQGREVFAVPGPIGTPHHRGSHRLLQNGAKLVTSVEDVLDEIAPALKASLAAARSRAETASLAPIERTLLDSLTADVVHIDDLVPRTNLDAASILETLLALELRGLVEQRPGMRFTARSAA